MGDAKSGVGASTLTREGAPPSEDLRDRVNRNRYAQRRRHVAQRVEPGPALRGNHHLVARLQLQLIEGAACCDRPPQRIALPYRQIGRASCRGKSVDLGGRRIIKKKNKKRSTQQIKA